MKREMTPFEIRRAIRTGLTAFGLGGILGAWILFSVPNSLPYVIGVFGLIYGSSAIWTILDPENR